MGKLFESGSGVRRALARTRTPTRLTSSIVAASVCALGLAAGQARAATYDLSLTGTVASGVYDSFTSGGTHYDQWYLSLSGLDTSDAITVSQGDVINATITLDQPFTIPASAELTAFVVLLTGTAFENASPYVNSGATGTTTLLSSGAPVASDSDLTTTSNQLAHSIIVFPPNNGAITFDSVTSDFTITTLDQTETLDQSAISYTLFSPAGVSSAVPEPATWALMILGLAGVGATLRRRRGLALAH